jgi:hypothetical protein
MARHESASRVFCGVLWEVVYGILECGSRKGAQSIGDLLTYSGFLLADKEEH